MPTLGQQVILVNARGEPRAAFVAMTYPSTTLHVLVLIGDDDYAAGPVVIYINVPHDASGLQPVSWH